MGFFSKRRAFTLTELAIVIGLAGTVLGSIWVAYGQVSLGKKVEQTIDEIRFIVSKIQNSQAVNAQLLQTHVDPGCWVGSSSCGTPNPAPPYCQAPSSFGPPPATPVVCGTYPNCGSCTPVVPTPCIPGQKQTGNSTTETLNTNAIAAGLFPSQMVSGTTISSPWGTGDVNLTVSESTNSCSQNSGLAQAVFGSLSPGQSTTLSSATAGYAAPTSYIFNGTFILTIASMPSSACIRILSSAGVDFVHRGLTQVYINGRGQNFSTANVSDMNLTYITYWCSGAKTVPMQLTFSLTPPN